MGDLVSFVCIRADHQWGTAPGGQVHPVGAGLGYCPDASVGTPERHEWRACDAAPLATAGAVAAHVGWIESAAS